MTPGAAARSVTLDLQAAQSPGYRDRGVARYATDFTAALVEHHPDLIQGVVLSSKLPPVEGFDGLRELVPVELSEDWAPAGGIFHVLSPFELDVDLLDLWPRKVAQAGMRTVVTVYDLIPDLFPEIYLRDPGQRRRYRARRELIRAADHVMTLSQSAARDVVDRLGIPATRVSVVGAAPSAIFKRPLNVEEARAQARHVVHRLGPRWLVYNGAVEPRKNMEAMLEAFAQLPPDVREAWQLVLVCRLAPAERNHFEVRARQLGVASQVLLTGFVPDPALVLLYQGADLAVCPSLYEGYGLPVAEAQACGAPVIASGTSSLVELVEPGATFDPHDVGAIAEAVRAALTEPVQRQRLVDWANRPQPTWADVADRAAAVYEQLVLSSTTIRVPRWRSRPRIGLVTPWPPAATGVARYNEAMTDALSAYADIDVFIDGEDLRCDGTRPRAEALRPHDRGIGGYDAVLLALGNSEFHAGALRVLRHSGPPLYVHAHDVRLTNLYLHGAPRGAVPEGFEAAFATQYPDLPPDLVTEGRLSDRVADEHNVLMLREVARLSAGVLVTSGYAASLARRDVDPGDLRKIAVWPFAYPPVADRFEEDVDPLLICSFGLVNPAKNPQLLIEAFAELVRLRAGVSLALVGPVAVEERASLEARATDLGVASSVTLTGHVDDAEYRRWLARAGLAVQLRRHSNGESSAAVAECLALGIPTVVTDIGAQSELAGSAATIAIDAKPGDLAALLEDLLDNSDRRQALSDQGRRYAGDHGYDAAARQLFELIPELVWARGSDW